MANFAGGAGFGQGFMMGREQALEAQKVRIDELQSAGTLADLEMKRQKLVKDEIQKTLEQSIEGMNQIGLTAKEMGNIEPGGPLDKAIERQKETIAKYLKLAGQSPDGAQTFADLARAQAQIPKPVEHVAPGTVFARGEEVIGQAPGAPPRSEKLFDQELQLADRRKSQTSITNILGAQETRAEGKLGEVEGDIAGGILKDALKSQKAVDQLTVAKRLADEFIQSGGQFGTLAGARISGSKILTSLGANPEAFGLPADVSAGEALQAISRDLALGKIGGEGGLPANNFSEADRSFITEIAPRIEDSLPGFLAKVEMGDRVHRRNMEAADIFDEARGSGQTVSQALRTVAKELQSRPLFTEDERVAISKLAVQDDELVTGGFENMSKDDLLDVDLSKLTDDQVLEWRRAFGNAE
jgi:hypothetical protein